MERHQFTLLHDMENSWWYKGRSVVLTGILKRMPIAFETLDFGAGFGGMFPMLARFSKRVSAFEPDFEANSELKRRGYERVYPTTDEALATQYDLIGFFDVMEHIKGDKTFLTQIKKSLTPNGKILLTVPAYQWLWSQLDVEGHHERRYTKRKLIQMLQEAGYKIDFASYWNVFLFPVAAVIRLSGSIGESGLGLPTPINAFFLALIRIEAFLMHIFPLPFGLSIVVLASPRQSDSSALL